MNNVKYVGMDVHKAITVIVVLNALCQIESRTQVKTKAETLCDFFRGMSGKVEVVFEEGTHSAWLHKLLKPLVASVIVCDPRHNKLIGDGSKYDDDDAERLAYLLRLGSVKSIYKGDDQQQQLKELSRTYDNLVEDATRAKNRIKAIYRGRGIDCPGHAIYRADQRAEWLAKLSDKGARFRTESLLDQLEAIQQLRKQAKDRLVSQVTVEDVIAYRDDLVKKKRRKARTVNTKLSVVRAYFSYLKAAGYLTVNPADISPVSLPPPPDDMAGRALTPEEVVRLHNAPDRSKSEGARDHALLLTLVRTSLRVSEVRNLRVSSIIWSHGRWTARVKFKGGRERTIPFPKDVKQAIDHYLKLDAGRRRNLHSDGDDAFIFHQLSHARIREAPLGPAYRSDR